MLTEIPDLLDGPQYREATIEEVVRREVLMRAVPYDHEVELFPGFFESFERGSLSRATKDPARVKFYLAHSDQFEGRIVGHAIEVRDESDGVWVRARVSETVAGDELLTLANDGVLDEASIEFRPIPRDMEVVQNGDGDTHVLHKRAHLLGVALVPHGAYGRQATVASVREKRDQQAEAARAAAVQKLRSLNA